MMAEIKVLYDGWSLVYEPGSAPATHLLEILHSLPAQVEAWVALPGSAPSWLPENARPYLLAESPAPRSHLAWEQWRLPALQRQLRAHLLHLVSYSAPLFSTGSVVVSPAQVQGEGRQPGLVAHLQDALSAGGMARLTALAWPEDLPLPGNQPGVHILPAFSGLAPYRSGLEPSFDLPETYLLYHGPCGEADVHRLLQAWSWAAGALAGTHPLLVVGPDGLAARAGQYGLEHSVRCLAPSGPPGLARLYRGAAALFHPAPVPAWGSSLRLALAFGTPVVAAYSPMVDALVGPAAYLVDASDLRGLGAALITVVLEDSVAGQLSQAALQRAAGWNSPVFGERLLEMYRRLA